MRCGGRWNGCHALVRSGTGRSAAPSALGQRSVAPSGLGGIEGWCVAHPGLTLGVRGVSPLRGLGAVTLRPATAGQGPCAPASCGVVDSATPLRSAQNDRLELLRFAQNDRGLLRFAQNDGGMFRLSPCAPLLRGRTHVRSPLLRGLAVML
jgi:hypothetical protein